MGQLTTADVGLNWGPYAGQGEATFCIGRFTDKALGPGLGIVWCDGRACILLREPVIDKDGFGYSLVVEWMGPMRPAKPDPPPTFLQRVVRVFEDAMEMEGEAEIAQSDAAMAEGKAISDWFGNKNNEHLVGLGFDILGVLSIALLFVPVVGEAEVGIYAVLATAGRFTAVAAAGGSVLGGWVDGKYVYLRYYSDGSTDQRQSRAREWDESPQATTLSVAAAMLVIPDLAVGGVMTVRALDKLPSAIRDTRAVASENRAAEAVKTVKAQQLESRAANTPGKLGQSLQKKAMSVSARAARFARRAAEAEEKGRKLNWQLYMAMGMNVPGTYVGTPVGEAYFVHDNRTDERKPFVTAGHYLRDLLKPASNKISGGSTHNFGMRVGTISRQSNEAQ